MTALVKINLGTPPTAEDGDTNRGANAKSNSNVDVLNAQATLTSAPAVITAPQALTAALHIGKRVNISLAAGGVINLPAASTCAADQVTLLRNLGTTVVTLAVTTGSGDSVSLTRLNPGETALMDTDGVHAWSVLMRGRTNSDNETVNGNCTVSGNEIVGGSLSVVGKVAGANSPNLLLNGSGEFGTRGWVLGPQIAQQVDTTGGIGPFFTNTTALANYTNSSTTASCQAGPGIVMTASFDIANSATAGTVNVSFAAFNSSGAFISNLGALNIANGSALQRYSITGATPASTAYVVVYVNMTSVTAAAFGVVWRQLKVEAGTGTSLYSQEGSVAQVGNVSNIVMNGTYRNMLHNARFQVNNRRVSLPFTAGSGYQYCLDRWRVVVSGQQISASVPAGTGYWQVTCPAGGFEQVMEPNDVLGGTYVINWLGTATCEMGPVGSATALVKGQTFTLAALSSIQFRWKNGTLALPQIEQGTVPTAFEAVPMEMERRRCESYWRAVTIDFEGYQSGGQNAYWSLTFPSMRSTPVGQGLTWGRSPSYSNIGAPPTFNFFQDTLTCIAPVSATGTWFVVGYTLALSCDL
ncbi:hypothetical protein LMG24238_02996 [Paraburkholderia sediminicola]|uniref:Tail fiber protein n=1 Tax=Paraburkholderia sediminicola TaxID=458836 RepID=A0A6J5B3D4_9BURK|nr:hypothetical protein [Paraburkholderia sediminicola]CAB3688638.1 hypothetical protein LMG24238_02996 [Paraburkholderia sediminicola]